MGLSINGQHVFCGDYIYSGHTVILTVTSLVIQEYTPQKWYPLHILSWIVTLIGVVLVMVAHGHYTIDVLIAYYITTRLWWIYHTLASNNFLKVFLINESLKLCSFSRIKKKHSLFLIFFRLAKRTSKFPVASVVVPHIHLL